MSLAAEELCLGLFHVAKEIREMHDARHVGVDKLDAAGGHEAWCDRGIHLSAPVGSASALGRKRGRHLQQVHRGVPVAKNRR